MKFIKRSIFATLLIFTTNSALCDYSVSAEAYPSADSESYDFDIGENVSVQTQLTAPNGNVAKARASRFNLGAYASTNNSTEFYSTSTAIAVYSENFIVDGSGLVGANDVFVTFFMTLDGNLSSNSYVSVESTSFITPFFEQGTPGSIDAAFSARRPVVTTDDGISRVDFHVSLIVGAVYNEGGTGEANFFSSLGVTGVSFETVNEFGETETLTEVGLFTESGDTVPIVPEPSTLMLLCISGIALLRRH